MASSLSTWSDDDNEAVYVEWKLHRSSDKVTLTYSGKITDNMTGIYPSYYSIDAKRKPFLLSLRAILLWKPLPSEDEPEAKATFDLFF